MIYLKFERTPVPSLVADIAGAARPRNPPLKRRSGHALNRLDTISGNGAFTMMRKSGMSY
jgi:hypothetical protein